MELNEELLIRFSTISDNTALPIMSLDGDDSWVIRNSNGYGVAIENINNVEINEKATSIKIWDAIYSIDGEEKNLIFLTTKNKYCREQFSSICAQFLDYGEKNKNRILLTDNPLNWWNNWKTLLGNKISEKVYDVLGELLVFEKILKKDKNAIWSGDKYGIIDITSSVGNYEVKSTVGRYLKQVSISSQYQLDNANLHLILCTFEINGGNAISINDVIERMNLSSVQLENVEMQLDALGYEKGSSSREKRYTLIDMRDYPVDDNFPKITKDSFVDGKFPMGISKITYDVVLDGIKYTVFE